MSKEENKWLHRCFYEVVVNGKDVEAADRFMSANYVSHSLPGKARGREALKALMRAFLAAFPDARVSVDDQVAEGDQVVSRFTFRGTQMAQFQGIPPLGQPVQVQVVDIARFEGNRCVERWGGLEQFSFWEQLGVGLATNRDSPAAFQSR